MCERKKEHKRLSANGSVSQIVTCQSLTGGTRGARCAGERDAASGAARRAARCRPRAPQGRGCREPTLEWLYSYAIESALHEYCTVNLHEKQNLLVLGKQQNALSVMPSLTNFRTLAASSSRRIFTVRPESANGNIGSEIASCCDKQDTNKSDL